MAVSDSDLTSAARIRNAALEGFARNGVAATSIRDVAKAAGVSAELVQHHYPSKDALRAAVDEYVVAVATEALQADTFFAQAHCLNWSDSNRTSKGSVGASRRRRKR